MSRVFISNEQDLKANATTILRRINAANKGGLLFLLNPVLALEEAGVKLSPHMNRHIRTGLKYGAEEKRKIKKLEIELVRAAGKSINVGSNAEVSQLLFDQLKVAPLSKAQLTKIKTTQAAPSIYEREDDIALKFNPEPRVREQELKRMNTVQLKTTLKSNRQPTTGNKTQLIQRVATMEAATPQTKHVMSTEVLEKMKSKHVVIPKILALRKLYEQSGWQFVNREIYQQVQEGMGVSLVKSVRFKSDRQRPTTASRRPPKWKATTKIGMKAREKFEQKGSISTAMKKAAQK